MKFSIVLATLALALGVSAMPIAHEEAEIARAAGSSGKHGRDGILPLLVVEIDSWPDHTTTDAEDVDTLVVGDGY